MLHRYIVGTAAVSCIAWLCTVAAGGQEPAGNDQPDCNNNGVNDLFDISFGDSVDDTGNGIPDECDFAPRFRVVDLGTLTGRGSDGYGLNEVGDVVGWSHVTGTPGSVDPPQPAEPFINHAYVWRDGEMTDLGAFDAGSPPCSPLACESAAFEINDLGIAVGRSVGPDGWLPVVWLPEAMGALPAGLNVLPILPEHNVGWAEAINNSNQIVGVSYNSPAGLGAQRALLWEFDGSEFTVMSLGTLQDPEPGTSAAIDINELGQITGTSRDDNNEFKPFIWLPEPAYGFPAGLSNLVPDQDTPGQSAVAMNDLGQVLGGSGIAPWIWLPEAAMGLQAGLNILDVPVYSGFSEPVSTGPWMSDMNNNMQLMATAYILNPEGGVINLGVVWHEGTWFFLDDLTPADSPWVLRNFELRGSINNGGAITGDGLNFDVTDINGFNPAGHGYLLIPTDPADINRDGVVNAADLALLLAVWGPCPGCDADLNHDGTVDSNDLAFLLGNWN